MGKTVKNNKIEQIHLETSILIKVAEVASSTGELKEILDKITHIVADNFRKDVCSIYILKPGEKLLCLASTKGLKQEGIDRACFAAGEGVVGWTIKELKPLAVKDIRKEPRFKDIPITGARDFLSMLAVPILGDGEPLGVITLQSKEPYLYSDNEIRLLILVAYNISTAMKNVGFYKVQLDKLKALHEVSKAITSILSMDKLLPYICEEVSKLFHARGCILRLLEGDNLQIKASYGLPDTIREEMDLSLGKGIAGWVAQTGKPLLVDDVSGMPANLRVPVIQATSVLCVPLQIGQRVIGTLGLYDKEDEWGITVFSEHDLNTFSIFASASSIAIENARLYKTEIEKERKILSLYWEVTQTKNYLESIIENSADAIIISDINGLITSWNKGAEKIYRFTESEVLGKFLPMVPSFMIEEEKEFIKQILDGKTIRNKERIRQIKSGESIEVSLTLSPIIDSSGNITGVSGISRDISEKKRFEKELIRKNDELSRLFFINSFVRGTLDLDRLIRMVLTVVTMGEGLGFNRAILFLLDEKEKTLKGTMGVGPSSPEEAEKIWVSLKDKNMESMIEEIDRGSLRKDAHLDKLSQGLDISLSHNCVLCQCAREKKPFNIKNTRTHPDVNPLLIQQLGIEAFGVVPLITKNKTIGLILVDNLFTEKDINDEDLDFLMVFTGHIASAIENARLFEDVSLARAELKNIFESITDLVYFSDKDYTLRNVNQAVVKKIGKPVEEIIGKKCYEVFHGKNTPWEMCPHAKTINTQKPCVEEVEDPYLGGTYVISSSPIFDSSGNFAGTVNVSRDISELHALREQLIASERMAALGEMAARVAHEIRNPLISVGGFARRLEKRLDGNLHDYAQIIVEEVGRLENILKEILSFVKGAKTVKSEVDLNELVHSVINLTTSEILEKGNNLVKDISESPLIATVAPDRIKEAVLNVITNANQATKQGTITVRTSRQGNEAVIEILDEGYGIKQEDVKHIFTPFYTTRPQGTGLGLAITHRIIHEHKGRIEVESSADETGKLSKIKGLGQRGLTIFKICIPIKDV